MCVLSIVDYILKIAQSCIITIQKQQLKFKTKTLKTSMTTHNNTHTIRFLYLTPTNIAHMSILEVCQPMGHILKNITFSMTIIIYTLVLISSNPLHTLCRGFIMIITDYIVFMNIL